ncbi:MAG TPA: DUF6152 family protein [Terriglobia bacterium]|nr:DUF6152 family protein [Terriglobia bacterium]
MSERVFVVLLAIAAVLVTGAPVVAHHGAASFDTEREITLKGTVTEWIWANPHCFLKFDAIDDTGTVRNWVVETQNPTDMTVRGWRRTSFKAGDQVTVTLQPVKNGAPVGRVRKVMLANGETLGTTSTPPAGAPAQPAQPPQR